MTCILPLARAATMWSLKGSVVWCGHACAAGLAVHASVVSDVEASMPTCSLAHCLPETSDRLALYYHQQEQQQGAALGSAAQFSPFLTRP